MIQNNPAVIAAAFALLHTPNARMRLPHVLAAAQVSRATIYERMARGGFPRPRPIGRRSVAWVSDEVRAALG